MARRRNRWFAFFVYFVIFVFLASVGVSFVSFLAPSGQNKNKSNISNYDTNSLEITGDLENDVNSLEYLNGLNKIISSGAIENTGNDNIDLNKLQTGEHLIQKK